MLPSEGFITLADIVMFSIPGDSGIDIFCKAIIEVPSSAEATSLAEKVPYTVGLEK